MPAAAAAEEASEEGLGSGSEQEGEAGAEADVDAEVCSTDGEAEVGSEAGHEAGEAPAAHAAAEEVEVPFWDTHRVAGFESDGAGGWRELVREVPSRCTPRRAMLCARSRGTRDHPCHH